MASTVLPNGIIIPEKYSRDWYNDLYHNWQELDNLLGGGTPKDGTLTIQKNGDTVGTFSANQATDETINIEVPTVNNGTLTIQQNGTTVDTFTANSSSDKTVNIQCVDLTSDQTVGGNKEFTGTTTAHDLVPSATETYNFGSPSYQWNNAYIKSLTINGVACGDILTHNVSEFVDVSSNQTIGGVKAFTGNFTVNKPSPRLQAKSTTYSSETTSAMTIGDIAFLNNSGGFSAWIVHQLRDDLTKRLCFRVYSHIGSTYKGFAFDENCVLYPENTNSALGTSTNKWKSFNGLNPGALSLPSTTGLINIASSITALDGTTINTFTPQVDGWLLINGTGAANEGFIYVTQGQIGAKSANDTTSLRCAVLIPVVAGVEVSITCKLSTLTWANIVPCQGNV